MNDGKIVAADVNLYSNGGCSGVESIFVSLNHCYTSVRYFKFLAILRAIPAKQHTIHFQHIYRNCLFAKRHFGCLFPFQLALEISITTFLTPVLNHLPLVAPTKKYLFITFSGSAFCSSTQYLYFTAPPHNGNLQISCGGNRIVPV